MEKTKLNLIYPICVEGKYDKIRLASFVSSTIITLGGFSAFNNKDKIAELKSFGKSGLIILTDSDKAGTFIRGKLKTLLPGCKLINVYSPVISGSDSRRNHICKDGILGVESIDSDLLYEILEKYSGNKTVTPFLTKIRAFCDGITGNASSASMRERICENLNLPKTLNCNMLIEYINNNLREDDYVNLVEKIKAEGLN